MQKLGGNHLFLPPSIRKLSLLINEINKYPHAMFEKYSNIDEELRDVSFMFENEQEQFIFNKMISLGFEAEQQLSFYKNINDTESSRTDIILKKDNEIFVIELKPYPAKSKDLMHLNRYLNNKELQNKYKNKIIHGILISAFFHASIVDEEIKNYSNINLYSFNYKRNNKGIDFKYIHRKHFQFISEI